MTDNHIDKLLSEWNEENGLQNSLTMVCRGEIFDQLVQVGQRLIPFLLMRIRDESPWLPYQYLLRNLSGKDIWQGKEMPNGFQAKQLCESAREWLRWGKENDLIDSETPTWKEEEI